MDYQIGTCRNICIPKQPAVRTGNVDIQLNGIKSCVDEECMVSDLLVMQQLNPAHVVIEINETILAKDTYAVTRIKPDDRIEILRFVGGG